MKTLSLAGLMLLLARGAARVYAAARNPGTIAVDGVVPLRVDVTDADSIAAASKLPLTQHF